MVYKYLLISLSLLAGTCCAASAQRLNCGSPPTLDQRIQNAETIKGDLQGKAQFLSKYIGSADLGGRIEATKAELYAQSPEYYPAQQEAYLSYLFCSILADDTKLDTLAKLQALRDFQTVRLRRTDANPICESRILQDIKLGDAPTLDGEGNRVGAISDASVSIIQDCPTPTIARQKAHLSYGYYNGSGTWRGEQHLILTLKSATGAVLKTETIDLSRGRCIYGSAEKRAADLSLDGGIGSLVSGAEISVSRVSGTQTRC